MAASQVPGDTHRNLQIQPSFSGRTFKHILVPIWLLTYNFNSKPFQMVVTGYTGRMAGDYPQSISKSLFLVLMALSALVIVLSLQE